MRVSEIVEQLGLTVYSGNEGLSAEVLGGYTSDLLSDVMGNAQEGAVWVTLQTHKNVMAIASLKDLAAVIVVKGNSPDQDTIDLSNKEGLPLLGTTLEAFEVTGRVYDLLAASNL